MLALCNECGTTPSFVDRFKSIEQENGFIEISSIVTSSSSPHHSPATEDNEDKN